MEQFIARYQEQISGVLSGFDRVVFRGTLRWIAHVGGLTRRSFVALRSGTIGPRVRVNGLWMWSFVRRRSCADSLLVCCTMA